MGGGRGTLLKDIKRISKDNKISFGFLEINENLMKVQKKNIPDAKSTNVSMHLQPSTFRAFAHLSTPRMT